MSGVSTMKEAIGACTARQPIMPSSGGHVVIQIVTGALAFSGNLLASVDPMSSDVGDLIEAVNVDVDIETDNAEDGDTDSDADFDIDDDVFAIIDVDIDVDVVAEPDDDTDVDGRPIRTLHSKNRGRTISNGFPTIDHNLPDGATLVSAQLLETWTGSDAGGFATLQARQTIGIGLRVHHVRDDADSAGVRGLAFTACTRQAAPDGRPLAFPGEPAWLS